MRTFPPHARQFSATPAGYPIIQLIIYVEITVPRDCYAPNTLLSRHALYMPSDKPRLSEVLKSLSLNLIHLLEWFTDLREMLITLTSLSRVKDPEDEQPEEDIHRVRTGRVPSAGASVPVDLGHVTLRVWMCSSTWKLSRPHGMFMEALSHRHIQLLTAFPDSLPFVQKCWWVGMGMEFQASHCSLVFLMTSPHPGAHAELLH